MRPRTLHVARQPAARRNSPCLQQCSSCCAGRRGAQKELDLDAKSGELWQIVDETRRGQLQQEVFSAFFEKRRGGTFAAMRTPAAGPRQLHLAVLDAKLSSLILSVVWPYLLLVAWCLVLLMCPPSFIYFALSSGSAKTRQTRLRLDSTDAQHSTLISKYFNKCVQYRPKYPKIKVGHCTLCGAPCLCLLLGRLAAVCARDGGGGGLGGGGGSGSGDIAYALARSSSCSCHAHDTYAPARLLFLIFFWPLACARLLAFLAPGLCAPFGRLGARAPI
jgi:hypothetical protein